MTEIKCANCGGTVLHEAGAVIFADRCPRCSASMVMVTGAHSARLAAREAVGGGGGVDLDTYRSGAFVPRPEPPAPALDVEVRGYLTQEGRPPDEADVRLRGAATVVGRVEGEIVVDDPWVSARHFQIEKRDGEFFLRDLGSSNGTFVNGKMVRSAHLRSGDRIQAGSTMFRFSVRHAIPR